MKTGLDLWGKWDGQASVGWCGVKSLERWLLPWKTTSKRRELSLQDKSNELKISTEKVQVNKHWRRGDKNMKKILEG